MGARHKADADPGDTRRGNQGQTAGDKLVAESMGKSLGTGRAEDPRVTWSELRSLRCLVTWPTLQAFVIELWREVSPN